jgi:DNA-binding NtrC family response regulator/streptogramin lyase
MWFGTEGGVSRYDGKEFINFTKEDGLANNDVRCVHCDPDDILWFGTFGGGVSRYDGQGFVNFAAADGFSNHVLAIYRDEDGAVWFGTLSEGVFRYDKKHLLTFNTKDGLASNDVTTIHDAADGKLWFGTYGGVSVYDGIRFINFTTEDGLIHNWVLAIYSDPEGVIWFGTDSGGISRYDGKNFINFTTEDGLASIDVWAVHCDPEGMVWFGTRDDGVSCYDGRKFTNFTTEDGLASMWVSAICSEPDGTLWFGTSAGISRYDRMEFTNFTTKDGLVHNDVIAIHRAPDGSMWFGTEGGGVSRYNKGTFLNFTIHNGLANNKVRAICTTPDGVIWFGTFGGGIAFYDGIAWTSLDTRDGLVSNIIQDIHLDANGSLWFATMEGITRYRRNTKPPQVYIVCVTTDQIYRDLDVIPAIAAGTRVTLEYNSIDFFTIPEKRQYRCRIYETSVDNGNKHTNQHPRCLEPPYLPPTKETIFDWVPEKPGDYIFEVQAIDRDLNYSEPVMLNLTVEPDPMLVSMQAELSYLRSEVGGKYQFESIIGCSTAIMQMRGLMERAIESRLAVLITGETGTGKELVAKAIHHNSQRREHPLLALNCGAIPRELLASELFGHRRGAFTGAREDKMGIFEAASGGTVILDEISEMTEEAQIYLLRVLEERVVQRLGEHIPRDVDVRVIAIANRDLMKEVSEGRFREDLYYRLSVFPIHIPPLRERIEDISLLAEHFLQDAERELDGFAPEVFGMLQSYSWPGNVRELRNAVHRAAALAQGKIQTYHFHPEITGGESLIQDTIAAGNSYSETVKSFQRRFLEQTLRECDGNRHEAARRLQMNRPNLLRLMKRLGIS